MLERVLWAVAAVGWAAVIFWLSAQPATSDRLDWLSSLDLPGLDKVAHAVAFGILTVLCAQALGALGQLRSLVLAVVIASAYGVTDELHQRSVAGRDADVLDWVADTVGAIAFATAVWFLRR